VDLLRKAKEWQSAEMRRKAADLIEETAGWLPWSKQKRAERLKKLEELRNQ
jgi:ADP-heptose:LPS heptosyltransferase